MLSSLLHTEPRSQHLRYRLTFLVLVLWVAFGLRILNSTSTDLNGDESWTYMNYVYMQLPEGFSQIFREPNNTLHILMTSTILHVIPFRLGVRLLSLMAGLLSVAVVTRIGYRLFNLKTSLIVAILSAAAYSAIEISQTARPYIFANLFSLLALMTWLENKPRWDMLFSSIVPFFHVGAMPVVMTQDVVTILQMLWAKRLYISRQILFRIPPYAMFATMLGIVFIRRGQGRAISAGQQTPTITRMINDLFQNLSGSFNLNMPEVHHIILLVCVVMIVGFALWRGASYKSLTILGIWLLLSYGTLVTMTIISDGPIKFIHLNHIVYALALLLGYGLARMPKPLFIVCAIGLLIVQTVALGRFFSNPFRGYSESYAALLEWHTPDRGLIYYQAIDAMNSLTLNAQDDLSGVLQRLPLPPPEQFYNIRFRHFDPPMLEQCDPTPIWVYWDFRIHRCGFEE